MNHPLGQMVRIARLTFLEAVRQRFFNFLLLLALALIASANFFRQFDFKGSELKFVADFGMGGILFFGTILAVVTTAQLFFSEIENRTALTMLAKPVPRWVFMAGKLLGVALLMLVFVSVLTLVLCAYMEWRELQLTYQYGADFLPTMHVRYAGLLVYAVLQWLKFVVLAAITMLVASFSNTNLYTVAVSFFIMLICQMEYIAQDAWQRVSSPVLGALIWLIGKMFPNFQIFNLGDLMLYYSPHPVPHAAVYAAVGYGVIYVVVFYALAVFSFRNREI